MLSGRILPKNTAIYSKYQASIKYLYLSPFFINIGYSSALFFHYFSIWELKTAFIPTRTSVMSYNAQKKYENKKIFLLRLPFTSLLVKLWEQIKLPTWKLSLKSVVWNLEKLNRNSVITNDLTNHRGLLGHH